MDVCSYGFAIAASLDELSLDRASTANEGDPRWGTSIRCALRPYAATPEQVGEHQPLISQSTILVYEGRVDNRAEIADVLRRPELSEASDGAVLLASYEAWGHRLAARVVGEYAYCAFDRLRGRLSAGTDAIGVRRIFYRRSRRLLWIASDLRFLFAQFPAARSQVDPGTLPEYFSGPMTPWSGRTIWTEVRQLPRRHAIVQGALENIEEVVWQLPTARDDAFHGNVAEVDEAFRGMLYQAVRGALRSSGPILCDVSGGYDSSTIYSVAQLLRQQDPRIPPLVGWSSINAYGNEQQFQDAVRQHFEQDLHVVDRQAHLPFHVLDHSAELPSGGFVKSGNSHPALRALMAATGVRCQLTGTGGDVLLQKGPPAPLYLAEWIRAGRFMEWGGAVARHLRSGTHSLWHLLRDCSVGTLDMHAATFRMQTPDWVTPAFVIAIKQAQEAFERAPPACVGLAREYTYRATVLQLPYHARSLPDQRFPLVSRPLVEFLLTLDWRYMVEPGQERVLLKRALRGILPETVRGGGTSGRHDATVVEGFQRAWPMIRHLLTGEKLAGLGVVSLKPFRTAIERFRVGYLGSNPQYLLTAVYLEMWLAAKATAVSHD